MLRFANQPTTTGAGDLIRDGHGSTGDAIRVEIFDPMTNETVDTDAAVTLSLGSNPRGNLSGGTADAVRGVATFPDLSIDSPGSYTLEASSPATAHTQVSDRFMVADTVEACDGPDCSFTEKTDGHTYTTTPVQASSGAEWAASVNLPGLRISCEFAPFDYPDSRQPNAVWYSYDDGDTRSPKMNVIVIDRAVVDQTPNNDPSEYRVCYSSAVPFIDRTGKPAQPDPWADGPSAYFGTTWFTGLLPDCDEKDPVAPCVLRWTDDGGNRVGTFLTPPGDPSYR
ncbi:MAG TPA: hypothetical protein VFN41_00855 [Candidatus Limnocylindrales bacterium]|nr:hypothetical protein [Candidatus Limnocylindrales bacterium]